MYHSFNYSEEEEDRLENFWRRIRLRRPVRVEVEEEEEEEEEEERGFQI